MASVNLLEIKMFSCYLGIARSKPVSSRATDPPILYAEDSEKIVMKNHKTVTGVVNLIINPQQHANTFKRFNIAFYDENFNEV